MLREFVFQLLMMGFDSRDEKKKAEAPRVAPKKVIDLWVLRGKSKSGDAHASFELGVRYLGNGWCRDVGQAVKFLNRAAMQEGHSSLAAIAKTLPSELKNDESKWGGAEWLAAVGRGIFRGT